MGFTDTIRAILSDHPEGLSPQEIRRIIKNKYPELYGTETHLRNVGKGHYQDLDHALLAQIYVASRTASDLIVDRSQKPIRLFIASSVDDDWLEQGEGENIEAENLEKLEAGVGTVYVLSTGSYTKDGLGIVKIGITTGDVEARISQLYTTGVPHKFEILKTFETRNYAELEQALHKLLSPYRINRSREFFTDRCLPYIEKIITIHEEIHDS